MNSWRLALQSFRHYFSVNLAIALGVAAATAVLTGALLVGDSMRTSLRDLALDRLGGVDSLMVSQGFFSEDAFQENGTPELKVPAILFNNGTVEVAAADGNSVFRANNVNVFGVPAEFWKFDTADLNVTHPEGESAVINQALLDQLGAGGTVDSITLRIPKPSQLPAESALGAKRDLIESLVDLKVTQVVPDKSIARFGLHPSQLDSPNIFVPIELLQEALYRKALKHKADSRQANVVFVGPDVASRYSSSDDQEKVLLLGSSRSLADESLTLTRATQTFEGDTIFDYWSLSSEQMILQSEMVQTIKATYPDAKPVYTYLANDIRKSDQESGIPFSMIAAIDFSADFQPPAIDGKPISPLSENEIVINRWSAEDLDVKVGDDLTITWYDPETTHGEQTESSITLTVVAIADVTEPDEPFIVRRRGEVTPPTFVQRPTLANDPNMTPEVPGVTDAESIQNWDLPFETAGKLRAVDDHYWEFYRTTPKAFVSLELGQKLWGSRFGNVTSFRIPLSHAGEDAAEIEDQLIRAINETAGASNFELIPLRENAIAASSGSTPFDVLFLALSMFVIGSGLILVSILFRLALQSRAAEVGLFAAVGLNEKQVFGIWIREMAIVCLLGAIAGVLLGIGYAALLIWGLKTWWLGAISKPIIDLHIGPVSILVGLISGVLICVATIAWSLRQIRREPVIGLLAGNIESTDPRTARKSNRGSGVVMVGLVVVAVVLSVVAVGLSGDAQAGSFMGSGFCILAALLMFVYRKLKANSAGIATTNLNQLAALSLKRNPLRSTLTIGLVAVASFLVAAVSSFRLTPTDQGTAGFDYVAQSSQAIFSDLNSSIGQTELLGEENQLPDSTEVFSFRFKPGEDASCNNLYQSSQPRVLGVPDSLLQRFDDAELQFAWGGSVAESDIEKANPWRLLDRTFEDGAIPVIIDKNTANYSLKIFAPGGDYVVDFDSGETVRFRVVGFLSNTILQGSLLIAEKDFVAAFPYLGGSRYFLIDTGEGLDSDAVATLEKQLGDEGFDAQSATQLLSGFMSVQNTYLSTFQSLGALGLLLGTFGLAAVQIRSVMERKRELGLMRAVGFARSRLAKMIFVENVWLLAIGLLVGIVSAVCSTLPHFLFGDASVPWLPLALIFVAIFVVGIIASYLATRILNRMNLLQSLRA